MEEFKARRAKLAAQLQPNSIALLFGATAQIRNNDTEFKFRQNSDFYYLTGFCEPDALMVITKDNEDKVKYILFNQANDPVMEVWNGKRAGQEGAKKNYYVDESYDILKLDKMMPKLFADKQIVYYSFASGKQTAKKIAKWMNKQIHSMFDLARIIHELRLIKSIQEIELMRKAAQISAQAHIKLMQACKPGMMEYQLEAIFNSYCLDHGCHAQAYGSIVAGGTNACTLHYTDNNQQIKEGDLVLVDAGAEYNYYAADITRTFPANGKFSAEQKKIYELVLQAQLAGIDQVKPGNTFNNVQEAILAIIVPGLIELGILQGKTEDLIKDKAYMKFYMHGCSHWLGLDVHDAGQAKINGIFRKFEPGMVLTVEPGVYIAENSGVNSKWLGIGIRIEDDVLVTVNGNEVLSKDAPKEIFELERARV